MFTPVNLSTHTQEEIDKLDSDLWEEELRTSSDYCFDCSVKTGEKHLDDCDIARCTICGGQRLSCDCDDNSEPDVWTGMFPGIKECHELKLICRDSVIDGYCYDLNEYFRQKLGRK